MAAITLGLAEVEERLQALRRRLNLTTAQHGFYIASSVLVAIIAVLVFTGLHASPQTFRILAWAGLALALSVAMAAVLYTRRRWLDTEAVARLADEHAQLTDRLATLTDLRLRPRPSRLAPVLVAQTLALGEQWQPRHIAPRVVPRSFLLLVASLLALTGTALTERDAPQPASPPATSAALPAETKLGSTSPSHAGRSAAGPVNRSAQAAEHSSSPAHQAGSDPVNPGGKTGSAENAGQAGEPKTQPGGLTDRLQQAIHQAFRPEVAEPSQLASRTIKSSGEQRQSSASSDARARAGSQQSRLPLQNDGRADTRSLSKSGSLTAQREGASNSGHDFKGDSAGAGQGSSPEGLFNQDAAEPGTNGDESKPFKLTITSFLRSAQQPGRQQDASPKQTAAGSLALQTGRGEAAISERQHPDAALRKVEIPPDYEDLVRQVFSLRPLP